MNEKKLYRFQGKNPLQLNTPKILYKIQTNIERNVYFTILIQQSQDSDAF